MDAVTKVRGARTPACSVETRLDARARVYAQAVVREIGERVGTIADAARRSACATLVFLTLLPTLHAEPQHMLEYLLPRGGSRGATVEVTFHGRYLKDAKEILFYGAGIKALSLTPGAKPDEELKAKLQIANDCPVGEHVLRLRTATTLTEAVTFWVSPYGMVTEAEKNIGDNDTIEKAEFAPPNSTIEGQILPGAKQDIDYYWTQAKQGQRVSVEVEAIRLGTLHYGIENDLAVRILDAEGKELGRNDDSSLYVQDPVLSIVAPRDGKYYIEIKQQVFDPPRQAYYRAHIGNFTRPLAIFPAGGQAGTTLTARILGDPTGERTEQIALAKAPGAMNYFAGAPAEHPPSPNPLRVSPYPNVVKAEGDEPTPVPSLPAALNGIIAKTGQVDVYRFTAKKGESWQVRVYARTLGAPMDAKIWIRDTKNEKHLLDADDAKLADLGFPSSRGSWFIKDMMDPIANFKPAADGEYLIGLEDARGQAGPDHVYRIEIEPVRDTIYTHITAPEGYQLPRAAAIIIPKGNRWTQDVQIAQGFGNTYKGDLDLEAVGLPKGVTMIAPRITKGLARVPVQFVAAADAEPQAKLIQILARPVDRKVPLISASRQGFALNNRPNELALHLVWLDQYALAVTQPAPFHISLEQPAIPLAQNGELLLKVQLEREPDFKEPVEIQTDWLPPGVSKAGTVTIAAGKNEGEFRIQANAKAAAGVYKIAMNASTTGGDAYSGNGRIRASSQFVDLTISEPYLTIDLKHSAVERGQPGQVTGTIHLNKDFPGKATVSLKHLPNGVKMLDPAPQITKADQEVTFKIEASQDALAGLYKDVACEVIVVDNGQSIHQQTGSGVLRVDPARTTRAAR